MSDQQSSVSKDAVFAAIVSEAAGFYKLVLTVASSFLGGSLLFLDRIATHPSARSVWILGLGWVCLIGAIVTVAVVRRRNLESGYLALEEKYEEARDIDKSTRKWSTLALVSLSFGVFFLMGFGIMNFVKAIEEERAVQNRIVSDSGHEEIDRRSIPFGSTGPKLPADGDAGSKPHGPSEAEPVERPDPSVLPEKK